MQTVLGKYEIRDTIATGPMSTVYDGWDRVIERRVAIKAVPLEQTVQSEGWQHLTRFKREAQAAGRLQHPAVVGIFDYGENAETAFIVMEFVDGGTLKSALENGKRFSIAAVDQLMQDILAGLQYSHDQGVIHRDIKPANIMLTRDGHAKIADFGIARIEHSDITQIGMVMGTPAYMSPEQFRGEPTSASTDIYSAGVILYQLLTGERPFDGGLATIMHKALATDPPKPSDISGTVPHSADAVVARAMAKRPELRFRNAKEFSQALHAALTVKPVEPRTSLLGALSARIPATPMAARRATAPSNTHLIAGALVAVLVAAGGTAAYRMSTSHTAAIPKDGPHGPANASFSRPAGETAPAAASSPQQASPINEAAAPTSSDLARPNAELQRAPADPSSMPSVAPGQASPVQPPAAPIAPIPSASDVSARALAPVAQTPPLPPYLLSLGVPNAPSIMQRPPQSVRKDQRTSTPHSVVKQPIDSGSGSNPPAQVAPSSNQPGTPHAERPSKDAGLTPDQTKTATRDTPAASSPPLLRQDDLAAPKTFGTFSVVNGRRVFVPLTSP